MIGRLPLLVALLLLTAASAPPTFFDSFQSADLEEHWTIDASAEAEVSIDPEREVVRLRTLDNRYNHIETDLPADISRVQVDVRNINDTSASWSPSAILYWDEDAWIQVMLSLTYSLRLNARGGPEELAVSNLARITPGTWYRVVFELSADQVRVLFGEADGELRLVRNLPRSDAWTGAPRLILGKGYMPKTGGNPDFDNNYYQSARVTAVEYDNVIAGDPTPVAERIAASVAAREIDGEHDPTLLRVAFWPNITNPQAESTIWFADGAWQRLALIYANLDPEDTASDLRFEVELPDGLTLESATFGPMAVEIERESTDEGVLYELTPENFALPPDFGGVDKGSGEPPGWFAWPRSALTPALHLHCVATAEADGRTIRARALAESGAGPWREMSVRVLDPLPALRPGPPQHLGISLWGSREAHPGPERDEVLARLMAQCARLGVRTIHTDGSSAVVSAVRDAGIRPFLYSWWHYSTQCPPSFQPTEAERCTDPGRMSNFCPQIIARQDGTYAEFLASVTDRMRETECVGFMLDYECAMPLCFDERCRLAFIANTGLEDVNWPEDVQPGGRYHDAWIGFRCWQGAMYVKAIRDAVWEALPGAPMQAWVAGYDYDNTITRATIDVSKAARFLTEVETPHYTLPADYSDMWFEDAGLGSVEAGIDTAQDTLEVIEIPQIFCSSIIYPLGSTTPWSDPAILDAQIQTIIAQGARGVSFWGGHFDGALDGRYMHQFVKWHNLLAAAGDFLRLGERDDSLVQIDPAASRDLRAHAWSLDDRILIAVINLSQQPREVRISAAGSAPRDLLSADAVPLEAPVTVPPLDGRWLVLDR